MLKNNKLLIDKDCPMCKAYGACFTQLGLIDQNTLDSYQFVDEAYAKKIDMARAKNEIALHDVNSAQTIYGLDALIHIVSHRNASFRSILHSRFIHAPLLALYRFISYNRKVIYPAPTTAGSRDCTPNVNGFYRTLYIIFVAIVTGIILNQLVWPINKAFGIEHFWWREYLICFGQIFWQGAVIQKIDSTKFMDYLGNMSSVSMIGGLLLIPVLVLHAYFALSPFHLLIYFMLVVGFMLLEHIRRCKLLGISLSMTISWVLYRVVILAIILISVL